jgi:hypothetical protein
MHWLVDVTFLRCSIFEVLGSIIASGHPELEPDSKVAKDFGIVSSGRKWVSA